MGDDLINRKIKNYLRRNISNDSDSNNENKIRNQLLSLYYEKFLKELRRILMNTINLFQYFLIILKKYLEIRFLKFLIKK